MTCCWFPSTLWEKKKKSWDKNLRFFLILFSLVLLCRKFRQRSWNICFDGFLLFLFLGLCWGSRRWGLEIKSELSEWDPVALVCVSSTHTNVGRLSPQIIQTKEDEKKSPQKEKKEGRISTRPRARFRALVVSCHLTWTNTHTPYPNDWSPVCFPTGGSRSSLFCFLLLLLGFFIFYSFINHRLSKTKKKGQDCCCFHLKSARSFFPHLISSAFFFYCKAVFILMARIEKWRREEKKNKGEKRMTPLIIYDQTFSSFLMSLWLFEEVEVKQKQQKIHLAKILCFV